MAQQAQTAPQFNGTLSFEDGFMHMRKVAADAAPDTIISTGDCEGGKALGELAGKQVRDTMQVCVYVRDKFEEDGTAHMQLMHQFTVTLNDVINYAAFKAFLANIKMVTAD